MAPVWPVAGGRSGMGHSRVSSRGRGWDLDLPEARSTKGGKDYQEVTSGAIFQSYGVKIDGMRGRNEAVAP